MRNYLQVLDMWFLFNGLERLPPLWAQGNVVNDDYTGNGTTVGA